jgi:hypothetical protein
MVLAAASLVDLPCSKRAASLRWQPATPDASTLWGCLPLQTKSAGRVSFHTHSLPLAVRFASCNDRSVALQSIQPPGSSLFR